VLVLKEEKSQLSGWGPQRSGKDFRICLVHDESFCDFGVLWADFAHLRWGLVFASAWRERRLASKNTEIQETQCVEIDLRL
jgi:hypothetical protein